MEETLVEREGTWGVIQSSQTLRRAGRLTGSTPTEALQVTSDPVTLLLRV